MDRAKPIVSSTCATSAKPVDVPSMRRKFPVPSHTSSPTSSVVANARRTKELPPSVAALLATTQIPSRPSQRRAAAAAVSRDSVPAPHKTDVIGNTLTRDELLDSDNGSTAWSEKTPLEVLLSAPEDVRDDDDAATSTTDSASDSLPSASSLESRMSWPDGADFGGEENENNSHTPPSSIADSSVSAAAATPRLRKRPTRPNLRPILVCRKAGSELGGHREDCDNEACTPEDHDESAHHPLRSPCSIDELDFRVFDHMAAYTTVARDTPNPGSSASSSSSGPSSSSTKTSNWTSPLVLSSSVRSAFKSSITASLKSLRSAVTSLSTLSVIAPDDFLTRSLLTLDPKVPYIDEPRPSVLVTSGAADPPAAALRRYLNPVRSPAPLAVDLPYNRDPHHYHHDQLRSTLEEENDPESQPSYARAAPGATIQMQTYRVRRLRRVTSLKVSLSSLAMDPQRQKSLASSSCAQSSSSVATKPSAPVVARSPQQSSSSSCASPPERPHLSRNSSSYAAASLEAAAPRSLRENSNFIRVAVLEMQMRRNGKLSDTTPGRARLALAPRKVSRLPYVIGEDGIPQRWRGVVASEE